MQEPRNPIDLVNSNNFASRYMCGCLWVFSSETQARHDQFMREVKAKLIEEAIQSPEWKFSGDVPCPECEGLT